MAIKFTGNALFTLIHQTVLDLMEDLDATDVADFNSPKRIQPYGKFVDVYGSLYEGCSDEMIRNEMGWNCMRVSFDKVGHTQDGLTPPAIGERDDVITAWLNRFIIEALSYAPRGISAVVQAEYFKSVAVLVAAALTASLSTRDLVTAKRDLAIGSIFYDYNSSEWNNLAELKNYDLDVLENLLNTATSNGGAAKQRVFYVQVSQWMQAMFSITHPLTVNAVKFYNALRQNAITTIGHVLESMGDPISHIGKEDVLENEADDLADTADYTEFKNNLLAEIVGDWNCVVWYGPYTADVLIHTAISNDMIEGDLFDYRHRILAINGDEALYSQY